MIDGGEGEEKSALEDAVEIRNAIEERDEIGEASDEADDELGEDGFRNVLAWPGGVVGGYSRYPGWP